MNLKDKEPELQDEVKHKYNETTGVVIAKYHLMSKTATVLDVRGSNDKIYYSTPVSNWEVVRERDE